MRRAATPPRALVSPPPTTRFRDLSNDEPRRSTSPKSPPPRSPDQQKQQRDSPLRKLWDDSRASSAGLSESPISPKRRQPTSKLFDSEYNEAFSSGMAKLEGTLEPNPLFALEMSTALHGYADAPKSPPRLSALAVGAPLDRSDTKQPLATPITESRRASVEPRRLSMTGLLFPSPVRRQSQPELVKEGLASPTNLISLFDTIVDDAHDDEAPYETAEPTVFDRAVSTDDGSRASSSFKGGRKSLTSSLGTLSRRSMTYVGQSVVGSVGQVLSKLTVADSSATASSGSQAAAAPPPAVRTTTVGFEGFAFIAAGGTGRGSDGGASAAESDWSSSEEGTVRAVPTSPSRRGQLDLELGSYERGGQSSGSGTVLIVSRALLDQLSKPGGSKLE